jgi:hypothetical protein
VRPVSERANEARGGPARVVFLGHLVHPTSGLANEDQLDGSSGCSFARLIAR